LSGLISRWTRRSWRVRGAVLQTATSPPIVGFIAAGRLIALALVVGAALVVGTRDARAQAPARSESAAIASDVSLEQHDEQTRVVVLFDRAVDVAERSGPARVVYRMAGARAGGRRRPVVAPEEEGPVRRVELVPAGRDLDLVIDVRRPVALTHRLVEVLDGFELRVEVGELSGQRPPARVVAQPSAPKPPRPPPAARPAAPPAASEARTADASRTLGGHTFLTPVGGPSPFVTTHLGLSIGFEHAVFRSTDQQRGTLYHAALGALSQRLELGVRLLPRLGLRVAGEGVVASGLDGQSALNLGAAGGGLWRVGLQGVAARIASTGTQVGAELSVEGSAGGQIASIAGLFDQAVTSMRVPPTSALFAPESSHTGRFAWSVAQAIGPHASAQAWLGWAASWTASGAGPAEHALDLTGGFTLTADASPLVPVAVVIEYDGDAMLNGSVAGAASPSAMLSHRGASSLLAGLYYSGRRDLLLGVLGGTVTRGEGPAHSSAQGRIELGYFF
jgi:hypothetical protein